MKRIASLLSLAAGAAGLVAGIQPAGAATFTVDTFVDDPALVACTAAPNDCSLRGAILTANAAGGADTVRVPAGVYALTVINPFIADDDANLSDDLDIASDLTLLGLGAGATIDASGLVNGGRPVNVVAGAATVTLRNLTLTGGMSVPGAGLQANAGVTTLRNVNVVGNDAGSNLGGGIENNATLTLRDSKVSNNETTNSGGGIHNPAGSTLTVIGTTLLGNTAGLDGGAIYSHGPASVQISVIRENVAGQSGGGIASFDISLAVSGSVIEGNAANGAAGYPLGGGGIFSYSDDGTDTLVVSQSRISGNSAAGWGGGVNSFSGTVTLTATDLLRNSALMGGGASLGGVTTIAGGRYNENVATDDGGALWVAGGIVTVTKSFAMSGATVARNTASDGAGLWVEAAYMSAFSISGSTIDANAALGFGGGAYILDNDAAATPISVITSTIRANTAAAGAGLYVYGAPDVKIKTTTVEQNVATSEGGGIRLTDSTTVITDSTVLANSVTAGDGAGIYNEDDGEPGRVSINNSTLSGNVASGVGGALYNEFSGAMGSWAYLFNVTIAENSAAGGGSGIASNAGVVQVRNSIVGQAVAGANCLVLGGGAINPIGTNLEDGAGCGFALVGAPLLNPLALNAPGLTATHSLQAGSPAINAGPAAGCRGDGNGDGVPDLILNADQRGVARNANCDLGSYEF